MSCDFIACKFQTFKLETMSEETPQSESDSSEPMMDPAELFLSSAADGDEDAVTRLLSADPTLLLATDDGGNSALHLAAKNQREAVVARLLNGARAQGTSMESALVDRVNNEGQTALDLSLQRRHRKISWTIIRSGGGDEGHKRKRVSSTCLLQALPDFENGNNFLHVFARSNYALQVRGSRTYGTARTNAYV